MSKIDFSLMQNAASDAASLMPSIAGKKILMGFLHNWPAGPSDGYRQGRFAEMSLEAVPKEYNVVAVAFMKGSGIPTFKPFNVSDAEFRRQVGVLNSQGRAVLISLGGADAQDGLGKLTGGMLVGAFEHQMLEEMRQSRFARRLVGRADLVPDHLRDNGGAVIGDHDHLQTVVERKACGTFRRDGGLGKDAAGRESKCRDRSCNERNGKAV